MGTRLLPSSDDNDNNFSGTSCRARMEIMINRATLCLRLFNYAHLPQPPVLPQLKPKTLVCTLKMGGVLTLPLPETCPRT
jgi:hypothetical protein